MKNLKALLLVSNLLFLVVLCFADYEFLIEKEWLTMKDGIRLSCTFVLPKPKYEGQKFATLLEYSPYRKDDSFLFRDYPIFSYFGKKGFVVAKVDVRGTGSSEGNVIPKEYSEIELEDGMNILTILSQSPWSNGKIGMFGKSWSAFNSIMLAMRRHPALKTIVSIHGSDDLYKDDIHYIDGVFHLDEYIVSVDHENVLPRSNQGYPIDSAYFKERFGAYPFNMVYLAQQVDGSFWRKNSLKYNLTSIQIPSFFIGGLYDGFRDTPTRVCEALNANSIPCKVSIGPWTHDFPDEGWPGPTIEWKHEAAQWFDHWLLGKENGIEIDYSFFVRYSHLPSSHIENIPGRWVIEDWPIQRTKRLKLYPNENHELESVEPITSFTTTHILNYNATVGTEAGVWWGDVLDDMSSMDNFSLVYDFYVSEDTEIIGFPKVSLEITTNVTLANWIVRLEEVHPNGQVSLVTGALQNGAHRESTLIPNHLQPGELNIISFDLHFTTWRFQKGNKIRLAFSNSLFRMIWPSPFRMASYLNVNSFNTWIELPVVPIQNNTRAPKYREIKRSRLLTPDSYFYCKFPVTHHCENHKNGGYPRSKSTSYNSEDHIMTVLWNADYVTNIQGTIISLWLDQEFKANYLNPEWASYRARARQLYRFASNTQDSITPNHLFRNWDMTNINEKDWRLSQLPYRTFDLRTSIEIISDANHFYASLERVIWENNTLLATKTFSNKFPRMWQ